MVLMQAQCSAVMDTLRIYEEQGVKALAAGGAPPWARLSDVLSEEAERFFRRRLRDALMDSLLSARPKLGVPKEVQEVILEGLLGDLDAVEEISPVGGVIYQRYLWTAAAG